MQTINVVFENYPLDEAYEELKKSLRQDDISIEMKPENIDFGGLALDPATIIVAGASIISSLITALFAYLSTRRSGTITITGKNGRQIQIPKDTSKEEIGYYIELAKELDDINVVTVRAYLEESRYV